jgi:hypothetical protein
MGQVESRQIGELDEFQMPLQNAIETGEYVHIDVEKE